MKIKIEFVIEGTEETLKDLDSGNFENGIVEDVLGIEEEMLSFGSRIVTDEDYSSKELKSL